MVEVLNKPPELEATSVCIALGGTPVRPDSSLRFLFGKASFIVKYISPEKWCLWGHCFLAGVDRENVKAKTEVLYGTYY